MMPRTCLLLCLLLPVLPASGDSLPEHHLDLETPDIVVTYEDGNYTIHNGDAPDAPRFDPDLHDVEALWPADPTLEDGFQDIVLLLNRTSVPAPRGDLLGALNELIQQGVVGDAGVDVNACGQTYFSFRRYASRTEAFQGVGPLVKVCEYRGVLEWYDSLD